MTTGNREDYLINILRITENGGVAKTTDLSRRLDVSPASVSEMIKVLDSEGLVNYEKYRGVTLTEEGMHQARLIRKRHHVLESFLMEYLDLDHDTAHEEACKMEHAISDESAIKMCQMMGSRIDDDCKSCKQPCKAVSDESKVIVSLNTMSKDQNGMITYIKSDDAAMVRKIVSIGIVPGKDVTLDSIISDGGPRMIIIGDKSMVVDYEMAKSIFVDIGAEERSRPGHAATTIIIYNNKGRPGGPGPAFICERTPWIRGSRSWTRSWRTRSSPAGRSPPSP